MSKPFSEPAYTQISNAALDEVLPAVSPAVWKLICVILRKTKGFQKPEDEISYSQLVTLTGMARATVADAIAEALEMKLIIRRGAGQRFFYRTNPEFETTSSEIEPVQKLNQTSSEIEPEPVQKLNTQKKERNLLKKGDGFQIPSQYSDHLPFMAAWSEYEKLRREKHKSLTPTSLTRLFAKFDKQSMTAVIAALNKTVEKGWLGVFFDDDRAPIHQNGNGQSEKSYTEEY